MDVGEKEALRAELHAAWTAEIRDRQAALGHESAIPAFLNLVTDKVIDMEIRVRDLEGRGTVG